MIKTILKEVVNFKILERVIGIVDESDDEEYAQELVQFLLSYASIFAGTALTIMDDKKYLALNDELQEVLFVHKMSIDEAAKHDDAKHLLEKYYDQSNQKIH